MVALKPSEADAFVARPDAARPVVLVFGPDAGLVRERVDALIRGAVDDIADPFALVRLEAEDLSANPQRLVEEAQTIPLFGGRRAVWARAGGRHNIVPAVEMLLKLPQVECRVVIEAGDLQRSAALRTLCDRARQAVAIACYADTERDLARLLDAELREAKLTIAPDAREMLMPLLGSDRQASRSELRKLMLYARGKDRIEAADVAAVVANASALAVDGAVDAAFAGRLNEFDSEFAKLTAAGTAPGTIMSAALRQLSELHKLRLRADEAGGVAAAMESWRGNFRRKDMVIAGVRIWPAPRLAELIVQLGKTALEARLQPVLGEQIVQRALIAVAQSAAALNRNSALRR
jgi:DNA polymerase-3 subunit delta